LEGRRKGDTRSEGEKIEGINVRGKTALTIGLAVGLFGLGLMNLQVVLNPRFDYYRIIGPTVGAMFVVAGLVLAIYGALKKGILKMAREPPSERLGICPKCKKRFYDVRNSVCYACGYHWPSRPTP